MSLLDLINEVEEYHAAAKKETKPKPKTETKTKEEPKEETKEKKQLLLPPTPPPTQALVVSVSCLPNWMHS
ncbi:hypothetical protein LX32DRAFT_633560, partial [Colletotrichum zoysiae]